MMEHPCPPYIRMRSLLAHALSPGECQRYEGAGHRPWASFSEQWIPACAGMTGEEGALFVSKARTPYRLSGLGMRAFCADDRGRVSVPSAPGRRAKWCVQSYADPVLTLARGRKYSQHSS